MKRKTLPPNPARLIEGLRDTGYDFNTALADIIDNSIDARASAIDIRIRMDMEGDISLSVADNGCGMDEMTLEEGMTYGAVGSENPKRLGKFGLGLKTASTAFCRQLSVITRDSPDSPLLQATWDLDHVVQSRAWELLVDEPSGTDVNLFNEVAANSAGTLVLWRKVDRLLKPYQDPNGKPARNALKKRISEFRDHAAMVFQRFLDPGDERAENIQMSLNGEEIIAWDPFCQNEVQTEIVANETLPVEMPDGTNVQFKIRAFVLPRREDFSSDDGAKKARLNNNTQGIYIYRENRLIHPADWLGMYTQEPHYSLLRIEFSFDHRADDAFQVDIKKSRILLDDDLYNWVLTMFLPGPRNAASSRYRKGQRKLVEEKSKNAHDVSNRSILSKETSLRNAEVTVVDPSTGEVEINNKTGSVRLKINVGGALSQGEVCVQPTNELSDGMLYEPAIIDGHHAVRVNTGHPYYHKVYVPNLASGVTIQGMDSLLWALVEAEFGTINESTKTHFEELRFELSRLLRRLVEDLPEPGIDDAQL